MYCKDIFRPKKWVFSYLNACTLLCKWAWSCSFICQSQPFNLKSNFSQGRARHTNVDLTLCCIFVKTLRSSCFLQLGHCDSLWQARNSYSPLIPNPELKNFQKVQPKPLSERKVSLSTSLRASAHLLVAIMTRCQTRPLSRLHTRRVSWGSQEGRIVLFTQNLSPSHFLSSSECSPSEASQQGGILLFQAECTCYSKHHLHGRMSRQTQIAAPMWCARREGGSEGWAFFNCSQLCGRN